MDKKCNIPIVVDIYIGNLENSVTSKNNFGKCQAVNPINFVKHVMNNIIRSLIMIFIFFYYFKRKNLVSISRPKSQKTLNMFHFLF